MFIVKFLFKSFTWKITSFFPSKLLIKCCQIFRFPLSFHNKPHADFFISQKENPFPWFFSPLKSKTSNVPPPTRLFPYYGTHSSVNKWKHCLLYRQSPPSSSRLLKISRGIVLITITLAFAKVADSSKQKKNACLIYFSECDLSNNENCTSLVGWWKLLRFFFFVSCQSNFRNCLREKRGANECAA